MGEWIRPRRFPALIAAYQELDPTGAVMSFDDFERALAGQGLLVVDAFYVPDMRELNDMRTQLAYEYRFQGDTARWVMCRETIDELARSINERGRTLAPAPRWQGNLADWVAGGNDMPTLNDVVQVIESRQRWDNRDALFGIPLRVDPAARSPMFELRTPATDNPARPWKLVHGG
jgi:hypothetical protein